MKLHLPAFFAASVVLSFCALQAQNQNVTTYKYDNQVSGLNAKETVLTPANVNVSSFGQIFKNPVDGQIYAQPLYLSGVAIPGKGTHNVVYVATCHDTVYAFDADTGGDPLWMTSFLDPDKGITSVPQPDVVSGDTTPEIGIMGTPVIDLKTGTLYVVGKTKETGRGDNHSHYVQKLHALDVATGAEKFNDPSIIGDTTCDQANDRNTRDYDYNIKTAPLTPSVKGSGRGSVEGTVYFNALRTNQRPSLTLSNGVVYIAWSSHGDTEPYHGWVIGFDAKTLAPLPNSIFCVTPDGEEGGIWQSGCGPSIDAAGNLYISTSNGKYDGDKGGRNWSQSFLKFVTSNGLSTAKPPGGADATFDYFTPYNEQGLSNGDVDIGSGGFMLFDAPGSPVPHLAVGSGKEGVYYVINRDSFGGFDKSTDHVVQKFEASDRAEVMATPIFFNSTLFYNRSGADVRARTFANGQFSDQFNHTVERFNGRGGGPVISANGTKDGILWMLNNGGPATLKAYSTDALAATPNNTAVPPLYDGKLPDGGIKFVHPLVVNGKVYAVSASRRGNAIGSAHLVAFGLLPDKGTKPPEMPTHVQAISATPVSVTVSWISHDPTATGFVIKRGAGDSGELTQVGTAGDSANSFNDSGVAGATSYRYSVSAVNRNGHSDDSAPIAVKSHDYIAEDGLIAYWSFDEGNGTTVSDLTGKGHGGKNVGEVSWSQNGVHDSSALEFHGTGNAQSRVEVKDAADLNFGAGQSFTIVAWARPSSQPGHWSGVVTKSRDASSGWYGIYVSPDNRWCFRGPEKDSVSGGTVTPNSWQQIVAVQDGAAKTRTLYVNGEQVATGPSAQVANAAGPLWIGQGNADDEGFGGFIDDVRIYNRALSPADLSKLIGSYLPSITITEPRDGAVFKVTDKIKLTATVSGAFIDVVRFYHGDSLIGDSRGLPYDTTWREPVTGTPTIRASVTDTNGNTVYSATIHIRIDE